MYNTAVAVRAGVVLLGFGTPDDVAQMEEFLRRVMYPRIPPPDLVEEMRQRYLAIGGRSPLTDICQRLAEKLEHELAIPVRVGMRNWTPTIEDAVRSLDAETIVGLPLAPQYSRFSTARYRDALRKAAGREPVFVREWHLEPALIEFWVDRISRALAPGSRVLFTAHSVPHDPSDPYERQVRETAQAICARLPEVPHDVAFQSRGRTPGRWLGPAPEEVFARRGPGRVVVAPVGFVCDHAEILYDIDIEMRRAAGRFGIELTRVAMPNEGPEMVRALAGIVRRVLCTS